MLDEYNTVPTKAEERCIIQISFRTQDPNIKTGRIRNPRQNSQNLLSNVFSKSANPLNLLQTSTIRALFQAKSVDPETFSSPPFIASIYIYELISDLHDAETSC